MHDSNDSPSAYVGAPLAMSLPPSSAPSYYAVYPSFGGPTAHSHPPTASTSSRAPGPGQLGPSFVTMEAPSRSSLPGPGAPVAYGYEPAHYHHPHPPPTSQHPQPHHPLPPPSHPETRASQHSQHHHQHDHQQQQQQQQHHVPHPATSAPQPSPPLPPPFPYHDPPNQAHAHHLSRSGSLPSPPMPPPTTPGVHYPHHAPSYLPAHSHPHHPYPQPIWADPDHPQHHYLQPGHPSHPGVILDPNHHPHPHHRAHTSDSLPPPPSGPPQHHHHHHGPNDVDPAGQKRLSPSMSPSIVEGVGVGIDPWIVHGPPPPATFSGARKAGVTGFPASTDPVAEHHHLLGGAGGQTYTASPDLQPHPSSTNRYLDPSHEASFRASLMSSAPASGIPLGSPSTASGLHLIDGSTGAANANGGGMMEADSVAASLPSNSHHLLNSPGAGRRSVNGANSSSPGKPNLRSRSSASSQEDGYGDEDDVDAEGEDDEDADAEGEDDLDFGAASSGAHGRKVFGGAGPIGGHANATSTPARRSPQGGGEDAAHLLLSLSRSDSSNGTGAAPAARGGKRASGRKGRGGKNGRGKGKRSPSPNQRAKAQLHHGVNKLHIANVGSMSETVPNSVAGSAQPSPTVPMHGSGPEVRRYRTRSQGDEVMGQAEVASRRSMSGANTPTRIGLGMDRCLVLDPEARPRYHLEGSAYYPASSGPLPLSASFPSLGSSTSSSLGGSGQSGPLPSLPSLNLGPPSSTTTTSSSVMTGMMMSAPTSASIPQHQFVGGGHAATAANHISASTRRKGKHRASDSYTATTATATTTANGADDDSRSQYSVSTPGTSVCGPQSSYTSRRTFPPNIPIDPHLPRLYRNFPVPSAFGEREPVRALAAKHGIPLLAAPPCGIFNAPAHGHLDLYTPRYTKGVGSEKVGACCICAEAKERGGEDGLLWLKMKVSSYSYHLSFFHGINNINGLPFSPPVEIRMAKRAKAAANEKTQMKEGQCHQCSKWVPLEGVKNSEVKVPELFWWKHAKACHKTRIAGEANVHAQDDIYDLVTSAAYYGPAHPQMQAQAALAGPSPHAMPMLQHHQFPRSALASPAPTASSSNASFGMPLPLPLPMPMASGSGAYPPGFPSPHLNGTVKVHPSVAASRASAGRMYKRKSEGGSSMESSPAYESPPARKVRRIPAGRQEWHEGSGVEGAGGDSSSAS